MNEGLIGVVAVLVALVVAFGKAWSGERSARVKAERTAESAEKRAQAEQVAAVKRKAAIRRRDMHLAQIETERAARDAEIDKESERLTVDAAGGAPSVAENWRRIFRKLGPPEDS